MRTDGADRASTGHRTLPHTADLIIEAWAPSLGGCLTEAVAALTESCADTSNAVPTGRHSFCLRARSDEETLVALLEEVLYVLDAHGQVPVTTHLTRNGAVLAGWFDVVGVGEVPLTGSAPKGISLSGLALERVSSQWHCVATVDV
jgi:SHS2 domain-containing protein